MAWSACPAFAIMATRVVVILLPVITLMQLIPEVIKVVMLTIADAGDGQTW